jgi:membrane associated rhomboid family serine protease
MLYLWIFGDNVEDRLGHLRYLGFYLVCGIAAALTQMLFNPTSTLPMVGASGAIAGVLGGYFILFPHSRVVALIPIWFFIQLVEIPAFFFLIFWFLMQFLNGISAVGQMFGGVAWWAHIGGFLSGVLLIKMFTKKPREEREWI